MKRTGLTLKKRFEVFKRDGFTCRYCGRSRPEIVLEIDHVIPFAAGGCNYMDNLVACCRDCNRGKASLELETAKVFAPLKWDDMPIEVRHHVSETCRKGGEARAASLAPERRSEIARKAAKARWAK